MTLNRRRFNSCLIAALGTAALPAWAPAGAAALEEGRDWRAVSPPQPGDAPGQIEVLEFFSYGCPHCRHFHPLVKEWAASLPDDVTLRSVPVTFGRGPWENLARLHFALDQLGELGRLDQAFFDALHEERKRLFTEGAIADWVAEQGVDREAFATAFNSFSAHTRLARANQLAAAYQINAVPTLAVGGRYVVVGEAAQTYGDLLAIADGLIAKARGEAAPT
ncbi:thiol:disulfide interchange protein DsbA/DsbL [Thiococcus pfennigii]|uniref:thiol:disulfide interchange protein DsbA/DsbL n=1 Tax=Thiococcus pfennigii TaxID=1057 RepID=UPI001905DEA6|nr:thiol:disulfide interchange protein DsbA/DsbL [Thiococcus pfennigii]MBK1701004.1 twin-arginine translocation pathway signal protein [Thiococcus pfennigii]